jgi:Tfp pilus assembly protein PilO
MPPIDKLFRTYQNAIFSVILLLFCVVATLFALIPAVQKVQEALLEVEDLTSQTNVLQKKIETLANLDETTLRNQLTNVLSAVPADRSFPTLFETIEGVAAQTGVAIVNVSIESGTTLATGSAAKVSAADKKLGTRTIPFSVTVNGSLPTVEQFITLVSNVRRLLRVREFSIAFPKELRPLTVVIEMDAFYEPLPTELGSLRNVLPTLTADDEAVIAKLSEFPLIVQSSAALPPPLIGKVKENPFSP